MKIEKHPSVRLILSTFASRRQAERMASGLMARHLAACCNVIPALSSFFRWKGRTEKAREALLMVKTTASCVPGTLAFLKQHHPYELPELIVLSLEGGESAYLRWIRDSVGKESRSS